MVTKPDVAGPGTIPPVITPVVNPILASAVLLLVHVPPVIASESMIEDPVHTLPGPVMGGGAAFTVTVTDTVQLVVYVMVSTPGIPPVTVPRNGSIDAMAILLLCQ